MIVFWAKKSKILICLFWSTANCFDLNYVDFTDISLYQLVTNVHWTVKDISEQPKMGIKLNIYI